MFSNILHFDRTAKKIVDSVEDVLGGNVNIIEDVSEKKVLIDWKKNDKTIYALHFQKTYSYEDLMKFGNPYEIASDFMESYKNSKELKVEEVVDEEKTEDVSVEEVVDEEKTEDLSVEKPKVTRAKKVAKNS